MWHLYPDSATDGQHLHQVNFMDDLGTWFWRNRRASFPKNWNLMTWWMGSTRPPKPLVTLPTPALSIFSHQHWARTNYIICMNVREILHSFLWKTNIKMSLNIDAKPQNLTEVWNFVAPPNPSRLQARMTHRCRLWTCNEVRMANDISTMYESSQICLRLPHADLSRKWTAHPLRIAAHSSRGICSQTYAETPLLHFVSDQDCRLVLLQPQAHNSSPLLDGCSPSTSRDMFWSLKNTVDITCPTVQHCPTLFWNGITNLNRSATVNISGIKTLANLCCQGTFGTSGNPSPQFPRRAYHRSSYSPLCGWNNWWHGLHNLVYSCQVKRHNWFSSHQRPALIDSKLCRVRQESSLSLDLRDWTRGCQGMWPSLHLRLHRAYQEQQARMMSPHPMHVFSARRSHYAPRRTPSSHFGGIWARMSRFAVTLGTPWLTHSYGDSATSHREPMMSHLATREVETKI